MVVRIDWRQAGVFYPTVGFFPFLWRIWHNVGRDTYSEHRTFILSLMRQAQGHEAMPKMLRESWHELHPSFLLKAKYLHGVEQMDLQKARCVPIQVQRVAALQLVLSKCRDDLHCAMAPAEPDKQSSFRLPPFHSISSRTFISFSLHELLLTPFFEDWWTSLTSCNWDSVSHRPQKQ